MKRSVILMGGKTYVISLPSEWVKKQGIAKGQQLEVEQDLGKITITADAKSPKKVITMEYTKGKLAKSYQLGYDEIKITGSINNADIESDLEMAPGFEIVQSSKAFCLIKSISEVSKDDFFMLLRKAILLLSCSNPKDEAKQKAIFRLVNICKRCISKNGCGSFSESLSTYNLLCDIEKIIEIGCKPSKALQEMHTKFSSINYEDLEKMREEASAKNEASTLIIANAIQEVAMARSA